MPCGCFGKKKKKKEGDEQVGSKEGPQKGPSHLSSNPSDVKAPLEDESTKAAKKKDVIASDGVDDCPLLGFRSTGSRPPSSYVDSPTSNSNSHPHTPSTVAALASSASSQASSVASSPVGPEGAFCRAQLEQKRREFFIELYPNNERRGPSQSLPSTLPTAARARQFGKVRHMRPVSQPASPDGSAPEAPPPPGPHLLRPAPAPPSDHSPDSGFASPEFLLELRNASDEISRRWVMSDEERNVTPSILKEKSRTQKVPSPQGPAGSPTHSPSPFATSSPLRSVDVVVTPPSPPSVEDSEDAPLSYAQSYHRPQEGSAPHETTRCEHTASQHPTEEEKEPPREYHGDPGASDDSDEDVEALKKLSFALKRDGDSFDLSDEPGDQRFLDEGAVHSHLLEGEVHSHLLEWEDDAGIHPEPQGKEPSAPIQLNHKGKEPSADTNISAHSPMD